MENYDNVKVKKYKAGYAYGYWSNCGILDTLTSFMENSRGEYTPAENVRGDNSASSKTKKFF